MNETLSIKVPAETKLRLKALARARKTKPSALLRQALDQVLSGSPGSGPPSLYDINCDLFEDLGRGGPTDLSTNPAHLNGFGQ